jgi:hypothetical protein
MIALPRECELQQPEHETCKAIRTEEGFFLFPLLKQEHIAVCFKHTTLETESLNVW